MYTLECEFDHASVHCRDIRRIFEDPYNLAKITPPWLSFRILTPDLKMRKGLEIDYRLRLFGIPLRWKTEITSYEPPIYFVDEARHSPYKYWCHHHTFRETSAGAVIEDRVEYDLPLGPLGRAAHSLVSLQLHTIFAYRQRAILTLLGEQAIELRPPRIRRS